MIWLTRSSFVHQTYEVNVLGALSMIQAIVPHMASQGRGKIINVRRESLTRGSRDIGCLGPLLEFILLNSETFLPFLLCHYFFIEGNHSQANLTPACCYHVPVLMNCNKNPAYQVGSIVGLNPILWSGVYSSSKAAVHNLTDTLRLELWPFGIQASVRGIGEGELF